MRPRSRSCPMPLNDAAAANKENEKKKWVLTRTPLKRV
jgi:hypothetical protein